MADEDLSLVYRILEGLERVIREPWTDQEIAQFHRRGVELLNGPTAIAQGHSSSESIPAPIQFVESDEREEQSSGKCSLKAGAQSPEPISTFSAFRRESS